MNKERFQKLYQTLKEGKDENFVMSRYGSACGTPACVIGHYASRHDLQDQFTLVDGWLADRETGESRDYDDPEVREHFDLSFYEIRQLFAAEGCGGSYEDDPPSKSEALAYLRKFAAERGLELE